MDTPGTVLVALDGSPLATDALDHALTMFHDAEITVLNVSVPLDAMMSEGGVLDDEDVGEDERERAQRIVREATERADERGGTVATVTEEGRPAETIVAYAEEHDIDHVVMGSHGRSDLSRILLGSVASSVVERSPVPVTVIR